MRHNRVVALSGFALLLSCGDAASGGRVDQPDQGLHPGGDAGSGGAGIDGLSIGPMIGVGDSVLEWHRDVGASIVDVAGQRLSIDSENRSRGGAFFLDPREGIPTQFAPAAWSWVVMNGGANDLNEGCGCQACEATLSELVSADGHAGAISQWVDEIRAMGSRVAYVGYYEIPLGTEFDDCEDELETLRLRTARMAEAREGVIYVDAREAMPRSELSLFAADRIHPSEAGAAAVGRLLAERIQASP